MKHLVLAIIEAERVPSRMFAATCVGVEILVVGTVKSSQTFSLVFHSMAVHYVHNHCYTARVSIVDKRLEVLGGTKAA